MKLESFSDYEFYCPKCGDMHFIEHGDNKCCICGSFMVETPHEYNLSQELNMGGIENKRIFYEKQKKCFDEVVSKSPDFDMELYKNKDAISEQRYEEFHAMMEAAKHRVKCHYCGSTNVQKISLLSKAAHNSIFGIWSLGRNTKEFHCNNCEADF